MSTDIQINRFDPQCINKRRQAGCSPIIFIIGSRGKGKSCIAMALMRVLKDIPVGVLMSGTQDANPFYEGLAPDLFIFSYYDENAIKHLVERQKKAKGAQKKDAFVLLDDLLFDASFLRTPLMRCIALNGRHLRITLILTTQYAVDVPVALRCNTDYVFLLRENNVGTQHKLFTNFGGLLPNRASFCQGLRLCTQNFGAMVIDNVNESVGVFRVDLQKEKEPFRMFSPQIWAFAKRHTSRSNRVKLVNVEGGRILIEGNMVEDDEEKDDDDELKEGRDGAPDGDGAPHLVRGDGAPHLVRGDGPPHLVRGDGAPDGDGRCLVPDEKEMNDGDGAPDLVNKCEVLDDYESPYAEDGVPCRYSISSCGGPVVVE